jgi:hypothetical protein
MMRKRLLLILGCVASVLLAGYLTLRLTAPQRHRITKENVEAIQKGMTEEEVDAILGVPAGVYSSGIRTGYPLFDSIMEDHGVPDGCFYTDGDGIIFIPIELVQKRGGKEWAGDDACVYVRFDETGRVAETKRGLVFRLWNESFLTKLRRWMGM